MTELELEDGEKEKRIRGGGSEATAAAAVANIAPPRDDSWEQRRGQTPSGGGREGREGCKVSSLTHSLLYSTFFACKFGNRQKWSSLGGTFFGARMNIHLMLSTFPALESSSFRLILTLPQSSPQDSLYSGFRRLRR